jgi:hypothetical protein
MLLQPKVIMMGKLLSPIVVLASSTRNAGLGKCSRYFREFYGSKYINVLAMYCLGK